MTLKLDPHDIHNDGAEIDRAPRPIIEEAVAKKAPPVEIIPGKGSGQFNKRVLRSFEQKEIRVLCHPVDRTPITSATFVHFRWK
jgi:hypothetical protein